MACLLSGNSYDQEAFRGQVRTLSWHPGDTQLRDNIEHMSPDGYSFVMGQINPLNPSFADIINFLSDTSHRGIGYDSVNRARGALSSLGIVVDGCRAGNHPLVNRFLRGVFNSRPPKPRYSATWDIKLVLEKLRTMEPLCSLQLKELTMKLIMLMAFTQAARVQTLHLLMLENISIGKDSICVWLGDNIKQCRPKFNVQFMKFKAYPKRQKTMRL